MIWAAVALACTVLVMAVGRYAVLGLTDVGPAGPRGDIGAEAAEARYPDSFLLHGDPSSTEGDPSQSAPAGGGAPSGPLTPDSAGEISEAHRHEPAGVCAGVEDRMPGIVDSPREWPQVAGWCDTVAEIWLAPGDEGHEAQTLVDEALVIMYCESRGYPDRDNPEHGTDKEGEYPVGLMQVSSGWLAGSKWAKARALTLPADLDLYDGRDNLKAARIIWEHFGGWSQWACAKWLDGSG